LYNEKMTSLSPLLRLCKDISSEMKNNGYEIVFSQ